MDLKGVSIVVATHHHFWRERHGGDARINALVAFLNSQSAETSLFFVGELSSIDVNTIAHRYGEIPVTTGELAFRKPEPGSRHLATREISVFESPRSRAAFTRYIDEIRPDAIIVEQVYLAYLIADIRTRSRRPLLCLDALDVMHERHDRMIASGIQPDYAITRDQEIEILDQFDCTLSMTPRDQSVFREMNPAVRNILFSYCLPPLHFNDEPPSRVGGLRILYLFGTHPSNHFSIASFLKDVWPAIYAGTDRESVALDIAGAGSAALEAELGPISGVRYLGYVKDLRALYREVHIVVNPVLTGVSIKAKNVEALAAGRSLVTTPVGAEGMESGAGTAFLVAESGDEFASTLLTLIRDSDRRDELGHGAREFANRYFSYEEGGSSFLEYMRSRVIQS